MGFLSLLSRYSMPNQYLYDFIRFLTLYSNYDEIVLDSFLFLYIQLFKFNLMEKFNFILKIILPKDSKYISYSLHIIFSLLDLSKAISVLFFRKTQDEIKSIYFSLFNDALKNQMINFQRNSIEVDYVIEYMANIITD